MAAFRKTHPDPSDRPFGGEWDWAKNGARLYPDRRFMEVDGDGVGEHFTFAAFSDRVDRVAGRLVAGGLTPGDRVAALLTDPLLAAELVFAAIRTGAVLVPVNHRLGREEVAHILQDAAPRVVITAPALRDRLPPSGPRGMQTWVVEREASGEDPLLGDPLPVAWLPGPDQVQSLIYTSGTTGRPKGAVLTLDQHWWNAIGSLLRLGHQPGDSWLLCMPLFHVGGQAILFRAAIAGCRVIVEPRFDAASVACWLASGEVTLASLVPTMLQRVLDAAAAPFSPSLRAILLGGAATPPALLQRGLAAGLPLVPTYGMTETGSQMATVDPVDDDPAGGARPLFAADLLIADPDVDGVGEILVRGPQVSPGYWVAGALQTGDGWLHTGDLGRIDKSGRLTVMDRRADLIVSGGENIYPAEVEAALLLHPAVERAAVVPVEDAHWGQVPGAAVVLQAGAVQSPDDLSAFLRGRLASYKVPHHWKIVDALPETANGKVLRREVQGWFRPSMP
ncbi:MAG: o-succinylbenzoate--CoA ligase [Clostridia bacterium]